MVEKETTSSSLKAKMPRRHSGSAQPPTTAQLALEGFLALVSRPVPLGSGHGDFSPLVKRLWFAFQRQRGIYDWILAKRCARLGQQDRMVLWWALTECFALDGLPTAVAVDTAVEHTLRCQGRHNASFVNAVLRGILRDFPNRDSLAKALAQSAPPAIQAGLSGPLYERWLSVYGKSWLKATAALLQSEAPVTARLRGCFRGAAHGRPYPPGGVFATAAAAERVDVERYYLQDPSTILAPMMLAPRPGDAVADLCAAPGGKSLILAEMLEGTGSLLCCDRAPERLPAIQENLAGYGNVRIECADAETTSRPESSFDAILLDVPCSNTGVVRRRPDVRWNYTTAGLKELIVHQRAILDASARLLKLGGALVYSTCSIEPEENIEQVKAFLSTHPGFILEASRQLLPNRHHDGAYAARLRRVQ